MVAYVVFNCKDLRTVTTAGSEKAAESKAFDTLQNAWCLSRQTFGDLLQIISLPSAAGMNLQLSSFVQTLQLGPVNPFSQIHLASFAANGLRALNCCSEPQAV